MEFCIAPDQLRKALKDIEEAEKAGFNHCLSVFTLVRVGRSLDQCFAEYSDLWERAHPTDGNLNWGRFQNVSKHNTFDGKKLVPNPIRFLNPKE